MNGTPPRPTLLLQRLQEGDSEAGSELFSLLYDELRLIALRLFRSQQQGHTLQPTAVVHEAFLKMIRPQGEAPPFNDRAHFFAVAARAMRQILVNHARDKAAQKRGGSDPRRRITLDEAIAPGVDQELDVLWVNDEIDRLSQLDERQGRVVELRLFGGLTNKEVAEVLGVSLRTVELEWKMAKAWLAQRIGN